ncbi:hypothetical protein [Pseudomonas subflava]|uniref:hypothetical protein n=1 Tax=Pseudomonas subflava TaxID=2952933 RepID=UPI0020798081|nr:hypothetical protein [Pseudomonas subflava]
MFPQLTTVFLALLIWACGAQAGSGARMFYDEPFYAQYIVDYWRAPRDTSRLTPGWYPDKPFGGGGPTSGPGVAEIRGKLLRMQGELMKHPLLKDPHGFSSTVGGAMGPVRGGPMPTPATGGVSIGAYPLHPNDKTTVRMPNGRYRTPGEASMLVLRANELEDLVHRKPVGRWNDIAMVERRGGYMLVLNNSGRPLYLADPVYGYRLNPQLLDRSRPAGEIQFLTVSVTSEWRGMPQKQLEPANTLGRMIGVLFLTDWKALLRQVEPSMR